MSEEPRFEDVCEGLGRALAAVPIVRLAYVFGSRAKGRARKDSDWDVAVLVDGEALGDPDSWLRSFHEVMPAISSVVPARSVDLVFLNDAGALLRFLVARDGRVLLARSEEDRFHFVFEAMRDLQDSEWRRREALRHEIHRIREEVRWLRSSSSPGASGPSSTS